MLEISIVGYKTKLIEIKDQMEIIVALEASLVDLSDIVVIQRISRPYLIMMLEVLLRIKMAFYGLQLMAED